MAEKSLLKPKQNKFVMAMLNSTSVREASDKAGVTPRTGYNWIKQDQVRDAIREVRRRKQFEINAGMANLADIAMSVLVEVMQNKDNNDQIRSQAAQFVIKANEAAFDQDDIQTRLEALEQREAERDSYAHQMGGVD